MKDHGRKQSNAASVRERFGGDGTPVNGADKAGVSRDLEAGAWPVHGMRIQPTPGVSGWYIWAGEYSQADDFFVPLHVGHLADWRPEVVPYLGLSPGWRFLLAPGHEDVWFDPHLLDGPGTKASTETTAGGRTD